MGLRKKEQPVQKPRLERIQAQENPSTVIFEIHRDENDKETYTVRDMTRNGQPVYLGEKENVELLKYNMDESGALIFDGRDNNGDHSNYYATRSGQLISDKKLYQIIESERNIGQYTEIGFIRKLFNDPATFKNFIEKISLDSLYDDNYAFYHFMEDIAASGIEYIQQGKNSNLDLHGKTLGEYLSESIKGFTTGCVETRKKLKEKAETEKTTMNMKKTLKAIDEVSLSK